MKSLVQNGLTSLVLPLFFLAGSAMADHHEGKGHSCDKAACAQSADCTCGADCKCEGKCDCSTDKNAKAAQAKGGKAKKSGCGCSAEKKS